MVMIFFKPRLSNVWKGEISKIKSFSSFQKQIYICDQLFAVAKVQHYRRLSTNLENLYNIIKELLETQKESTKCLSIRALLIVCH